MNLLEVAGLAAGYGQSQVLFDIGLAVAYVVYAYAFNLGYDRVFPIAQNA